MNQHSRRDFFRMSTGAAGMALLPRSIARALSITADKRTGTIQDVRHVVILMQENRSFDHYFGTMRGVRGFGDPRPALRPDGKPIWYQPPALVRGKHYKSRGLQADARYVLPWYINPKRTTEYQAGTDHGWASGHGAWNDGRWDRWVTHKQDVLTMGHLRRQDVSFHYALADAFTICDSYFCSVHADTCPNRIHLWSGTCDARNRLGRKPNGPGLWERSGTNGYTWTTYPERLEAAGVSWKLYQGGTGEPGTPKDNYTDNSLEFFSAFHVKAGADPHGPLVQKGVTDHTLLDFRNDVLAGRLAEVNWIVAPYKYCEHPEASPTDGAYYIHKVLEALTADPAVWSRTVLFLNYDENDGLFDHVIPPMPPASNSLGAHGMVSSDLAESLPDEFINLDLYPNEEHPLIPGHIDRGLQPIGLGPRVPMIIASPWTRGGWVCSETFDHTSVLRFLEVRFGVHEPNISAWRRSVCGDLTSAFDFSNPADHPPVHIPIPTRIVSKHQPYHVPAEQSMPAQEPGNRPARALPYELIVNGRSDGTQFWIDFANQGRAGAAFQVHDRARAESAPRRYAISSGAHLSDTWQPAGEASDYDVIVYGPNGFLRHFRGKVAQSPVEVEISYVAAQPALHLSFTNNGDGPVLLKFAESYSGTTREFSVPPGATQQTWDATGTHGWYDLSLTGRQDHFLRRFAGHIETGQPSVSDPAFSAASG